MSTFGTHFRVTTYGESHCPSVGCIVDSPPPGLPLTQADIQPALTRRRPGQSALTTPRNEKDRVEIQSGTEFGVTLGTPVCMIVRNEDQRPHDYGQAAGGRNIDQFPRPSHADWTYLEKYGVKASSGGGRSSARETIGMFTFLRLVFWFGGSQWAAEVDERRDTFVANTSLICRSSRSWRHRREIPHTRLRSRDCRVRQFCGSRALVSTYT